MDKKMRLREVLKNKDYVAFWLSSTFSMTASNLLQFLLALYILDITGSATIFASLVSVIILPRIILTPLAGVIGDRYSRIRLMTFISSLATLLLAVFSLISYKNDGLLLWEIYVLVISLEIIEVFYQAPESAIIPELVDKSLLKEALTLSKIDDGIVFVLTPALGAIIYKLFGITGGLFLATSFFALAVFLRIFIKPKYENKKKEVQRSFFGGLKDGMKIISENPFMKRFVVLGPIFNLFFNSFFTVSIIYLLLNIYEVGEGYYAFYRSVTASMVIIVPFFVVPLTKKYETHKIMIKTTMIIALSLGLIFLAIAVKYLFPQVNTLIIFGLIIVFDCLSIAAAILMQMSNAVLIHEQVPDQYKSRVLSVLRMMGMSALALGKMGFGWVTDALPAYAPALLAALGTGVCWRMFVRVFRDYEEPVA